MLLSTLKGKMRNTYVHGSSKDNRGPFLSLSTRCTAVKCVKWYIIGSKIQQKIPHAAARSKIGSASTTPWTSLALLKERSAVCRIPISILLRVASNHTATHPQPRSVSHTKRNPDLARLDTGGQITDDVPTQRSPLNHINTVRCRSPSPLFPYALFRPLPTRKLY